MFNDDRDLEERSELCQREERRQGKGGKKGGSNALLHAPFGIVLQVLDTTYLTP